MTKNGNPDHEHEPVLDLDHELPEGENPDLRADVVKSESQASGQAETSESALQLQQLQGERDELYDRLARLQAEFDNFRKRMQREQQDYRDYALANAIRELLPVVDNFELALRAPAAGDASDLRAGLELIMRQLEDALARMGVTPVAARGEPFDPRLHEAIEMVETDEVPDHHVLEELRRGYRLKDRLLRPAMVRVAKKPGT